MVNFINTIDFEQYPISRINVEITNDNTHVKWLTIYKDKRLNSFNEFSES